MIWVNENLRCRVASDIPLWRWAFSSAQDFRTPTLILNGSGDIADNHLRSRVFSKLPLAPRPANIEVTQNPVSREVHSQLFLQGGWKAPFSKPIL
jgi:hypothetical protein